ncbi:MAG: ATP-binding protein [Balneolales bacterium]|nr:ATP-binding protein [Balneolales bacterium]
MTNATQLTSEMVAFLNSRGGVILIGVSDDKEIMGLSEADIGSTNQLISNSIEQNVRPHVTPITEVVKLIKL